MEAVPVPDVRGTLRDDADTVDVIDSCPLRKQLLGEPRLLARAAPRSVMGGVGLEPPL